MITRSHHARLNSSQFKPGSTGFPSGSDDGAVQCCSNFQQKRSFLMLRAFTCAVLLAAGITMAHAQTEARATPIPAPETDTPLAKGPHQTAVFGGGCYWGTQAVFERLKGVETTQAGFSVSPDDVTSAPKDKPNYAESVRVVYNPAKISYGQLLRIFFSVAHDPTQLNRQDSDVGPQYRSVIFYQNDEQQRLARAYITQLDTAHIFPAPIVTQVVPLKKFTAAEDAQQDFALKNPDNPYIQQCDRPKLAALKQQFPELFQKYMGR
jgi:peptide-methionine (S)-S-oxide reductase